MPPSGGMPPTSVHADEAGDLVRGRPGDPHRGPGAWRCEVVAGHTETAAHDHGEDGYGHLGEGDHPLAAAGHHRDVQRSGQTASPHLVAEQRQGVRAGPDKGQAVCFAEFRKRRILREKAVARMHAIAAGLPGDVDECPGVQVRPDRVARIAGEFPGLGYEPRVQRPCIDRRMDTDGFDTERRCRLGDTNRDLTPIGNQHALEPIHLPLPEKGIGGTSEVPPCATVCRMRRVGGKWTALPTLLVGFGCPGATLPTLIVWLRQNSHRGSCSVRFVPEVRWEEIMTESVDQRIRDLGILLPAPLQVPPGVELPFAMVRTLGKRILVAGHGPPSPTNGSR